MKNDKMMDPTRRGNKKWIMVMIVIGTLVGMSLVNTPLSMLNVKHESVKAEAQPYSPVIIDPDVSVDGHSANTQALLMNTSTKKEPTTFHQSKILNGPGSSDKIPQLDLRNFSIHGITDQTSYSGSNPDGKLTSGKVNETTVKANSSEPFRNQQLPNISANEPSLQMKLSQPKPMENSVKISQPQTTVKTNSSQTSFTNGAGSKITVNRTTAQRNYNGPDLWIQVQEFAEGMAAWRIAFAEILTVAKKLNMTLVEPCIFDGRLRACKDNVDPSNYRFGQVYDLKVLKKYHPYIVSHQDYMHRLQRADLKIHHLCFANPTSSQSVNSACGNLSNSFREQRISELEEAVKHGSGVLQIKFYRKFGLEKLRTMEQQGVFIYPRQLKKLMLNHFEFRKEHHDTVRKLLKDMGIHNSSYNVIHWRAEAQIYSKVLDYDSCATKVLEARSILSPDNNTPTILMSSLNLVRQMQWSKAFKQKDAVASLQRLLDAGIHKIDQVREKYHVPDMVVLAVWDQIMAAEAQQFTTCGQECGRSHSCTICGYQGNFAQMALDTRSKYGKSSASCWPTYS